MCVRAGELNDEVMVGVSVRSRSYILRPLRCSAPHMTFESQITCQQLRAEPIEFDDLCDYNYTSRDLNLTFDPPNAKRGHNFQSPTQLRDFRFVRRIFTNW